MPEREIDLALQRKKRRNSKEGANSVAANSAEPVSALDILRADEETDSQLAALVEEERRKLKLGLRLRQMREQSGMTQAQLAREIGTAQPAIARIESGEYERVSLTTLIKIAHALGFNIDLDFRRSKKGRIRVSQERLTSLS